MAGHTSLCLRLELENGVCRKSRQGAKAQLAYERLWPACVLPAAEALLQEERRRALSRAARRGAALTLYHHPSVCDNNKKT